MSRRKFLKKSVLAAGSIMLAKLHVSATEFNYNLKKDIVMFNPVVISTWNHGMEANKAAWEILSNHGASIDAAEAGVKITESDAQNRSVGLGGLPDKEGKVTLDACIMNHENECGSVAFLQNIEHPISVARKVMEDTPHVMLVGKGAYDFAMEKGFKKRKLITPETKADWKEWKKSEQQKKPEINSENHDTIGMLAMDKNGRISGACTTSGWAYKLHGRVGDSPIIGAGLFIDNEVGGACATGLGEAVIRIAGSHTVVELMRQGKSPDEACKLAVERIISKHKNIKGLQVGFLAINNAGEVGGYSVYAGFNYALKNNSTDQMIDTKYKLEW